MIALCCVDTKTLTFRRYVLQVHAGVRRAVSTHEFAIERPQQDNLPLVINQIRNKVYPGMSK